MIKFDSGHMSEDESRVCRIAWSDQLTLFVSFGDAVRVCNIKRRDANEAKLKDLPEFMVEIVHSFRLDTYWLSGIAPMDRLLVLLAIPKVKSEDGDEEENRPQLLVVEPLEDDFNEVSIDYLCLKDYENYKPADLHLHYLLEDKHYFIVSPKDIFFGKPRDTDDHIDWLISQEQVSK